MADEDLTGPRECEKSGEFKAGGVFFRDFKPYMKWDEPEFPNDIMAFKYLRDRADEYANSGNYSSKVAGKYHLTIAFLKDILGEAIYSWGVEISHDELDDIS